MRKYSSRATRTSWSLTDRIRRDDPGKVTIPDDGSNEGPVRLLSHLPLFLFWFFTKTSARSTSKNDLCAGAVDQRIAPSLHFSLSYSYKVQNLSRSDKTTPVRIMGIAKPFATSNYDKVPDPYRSFEMRKTCIIIRESRVTESDNAEKSLT